MAALTIVRPERRRWDGGANSARASSRHGELLLMEPVATRACDGRRAPRGAEIRVCVSEICRPWTPLL